MSSLLTQTTSEGTFRAGAMRKEPTTLCCKQFSIDVPSPLENCWMRSDVMQSAVSCSICHDTMSSARRQMCGFRVGACWWEFIFRDRVLVLSEWLHYCMSIPVHFTDGISSKHDNPIPLKGATGKLWKCNPWFNPIRNDKRMNFELNSLQQHAVHPNVMLTTQQMRRNTNRDGFRLVTLGVWPDGWTKTKTTFKSN